METDYTYDANNNLTQVDQYGGVKGSTGQTEVKRNFNYNSLSQLLCASNPESATNPLTPTNFTPVACPSPITSYYTAGTLGYSYDANGNVQTRTDARGVTVTYGYDAGNRVLSKTYNDQWNTPSVSFAYDSGVLGITGGNYVGRLAQVETLAGNSMLYNYSTLGYDQVGRPLGYLDCPGVSDCTTGTTVLGAKYMYDLVGNLTQATSQGTVTSNGVTTGVVNQRNYTYDAASQLSTVTADARLVGGQDAGAVTLFSSPTYDAAGQLTAAGLSLNPSTQQSMIGLTRSYDARLRPLSESDTGQIGTPGTSATVTVSVAGTEQSIGGSGSPTHATGTISFTDSGAQVLGPRPLFLANSITLPGGYHTGFVTPTETAIGVANSLAAVLNGASSPVTAVVSAGGTAGAASLVLTSKASGTDENGAITLTLTSSVVKATPGSMSGGARRHLRYGHGDGQRERNGGEHQLRSDHHFAIGGGGVSGSHYRLGGRSDGYFRSFRNYHGYRPAGGHGRQRLAGHFNVGQ
jgi:YD repeat-containing protein